MRVRLFATAAAVLFTALAAHATNINFNNLSGANGSAFTSYTQGGFSVQNSAGQFLVATDFGDPVPSLFSGGQDSSFAPLATRMASITITLTNGGAFNFDSVDLANQSGNGTFSFSGSFDGTSVFTQSGSIPTIPFFDTFDSTSPTLDLTSLTIMEKGGDFNLDNILVTRATAAVTPEPSSFLLLGTGLMGVLGVARRRFV